MANLKGPGDTRKAKKIFWMGVVCALVLGLSIREIFDSARLRRWTDRALVQAQHDTSIEYRSVGLSLSHGGLPALAVEVTGLKMQSKSPCAFVQSVEADKLFLPLSIWKLFGRRLEVGVARLDGGKVVLHPSEANCAGTLENVANQIDQKWLTALSEQLHRLRKNLPVEAVRLGDVQVFWENASNPVQVELSYFQLRHLNQDGPILFDGLAQMPEWLGVTGLPRIHMHGEWAEQKATAVVRGHWKEGSLALDLALENEHNQNAILNADLEVSHLPLSHVNQVVEKLWHVASQTEPKPAIWFSCQAHLQSTIEKIKSSTVMFKPCHLQGDLGEIEVSGIAIKNPLAPEQTSDLTLQLQRVNVNALRDVIGWSPRWGLSQAGFIDGTVKVDATRQRLEGSGTWKDFEWSANESFPVQHLRVQRVNVTVKADKNTAEMVLNDWQADQAGLPSLKIYKNNEQCMVTTGGAPERAFQVLNWRTDKPQLISLKDKKLQKIKEEKSREPSSNEHHLAGWALFGWLFPPLQPI